MATLLSQLMKCWPSRWRRLPHYTHADAVKGHVLAALDRRVAAVVSSSGLSAADYAGIDERTGQQRVGVIAAGNFRATAELQRLHGDLAATSGSRAATTRARHPQRRRAPR